MLAHLWKMQLCKLLRAALGKCSWCETMLLSLHQHSWSIQSHQPLAAAVRASLPSSPLPRYQIFWATTAPHGPQLFSRVALEDSKLCSDIPCQAASPASSNNGTKNNGERTALGWIPFGLAKISNVLQFWVLQSSPGWAQGRAQSGRVLPGRGASAPLLCS